MMYDTANVAISTYIEIGVKYIGVRMFHNNRETYNKGCILPSHIEGTLPHKII